MQDEALETLRQECAELLGFANAIHRSGRRMVYINALVGCLMTSLFGVGIGRGWPWPANVFLTCALLGLVVDTFLSWRRLRKCTRLRFHLQRVMARDSNWLKHWNNARQLCKRL